MIDESVIRAIAARELASTFDLGELRAMRDGWWCFEAVEKTGAVPLSLRIKLRTAESQAWELRFGEIQQRIVDLDHPHLARSRSYGFTGQLVWATHRTEGESLAELLDRTGGMDLHGCLRVAEQVASVLDYIHRRDLSHGTLTAADIRIVESGWVVVAGFGMADRLESGGSAVVIDQRALAEIVWLCLAGTPRSATRQFEGGPVPPRIRMALDRVLGGPAVARYSTALAFVSTLGAVEEDVQRVMVPGDDQAEAAPESGVARVRRWVVPASIAAVLLLAVVGTVAALRWRVATSSASFEPAPEPRAVAVTPSPSAPPSAASAPAPPPVELPVVSPPAAGRRRAVPREPAPAESRGLVPPAQTRSVVARSRPPETGGNRSESVASRPGFLFVSTRPWGALSVDGKPIANTPVADLEVPPGSHVVRITRPGFRPHEQTIEVKSGDQVRLVDLILEPASP